MKALTRPATPAIVLLSLTAIFALLAENLVTSILAERPAGSAFENLTQIPDPSLAVPERFDALAQNPPFREDRQGITGAVPQSAENRFSERYRLSGTLITEGARRALFIDLTTKEALTLAEGEALGPYIIGDIRADRLDLIGPQGRETLILGAANAVALGTD